MRQVVHKHAGTMMIVAGRTQAAPAASIPLGYCCHAAADDDLDLFTGDEVVGLAGSEVGAEDPYNFEPDCSRAETEYRSARTLRRHRAQQTKRRMLMVRGCAACAQAQC